MDFYANFVTGIRVHTNTSSRGGGTIYKIFKIMKTCPGAMKHYPRIFFINVEEKSLASKNLWNQSVR